MNRAPRLLALACSALLLTPVPAAAQQPGVDVQLLDALCASNARTAFEYQLCTMVVHTFLVPEPFNPDPSGTYAPDGPQGVQGAAPDGAVAVTESPSP